MREGWETRSLGDVCALINRGVAPKYVETGGVAVLNQKCVRDHRIAFDLGRRHDAVAKKVDPERFVRVGDVLVNSTGTGTLGRVAQVRSDPSEPTTVDTHVTIVRPAAGHFYPDFFGYMLIQIEDEIARSGEGASGQTELARSTLQNKFVISFPTSLLEQQRIVSILDEAFAGLATATANAEKNLKNARELLQSTMNSALSGRDSSGNSWPSVALQELAAEGRAISYGVVKPGRHDPSGVRLIKSQQVRDGSMDLSEDFRITNALDKEYARTRLQGGEILLNLVGASIGRSAIAPEEIRGANVSRAIAVIPVPRDFSPWVQYNLRGRIGQRLIQSATGGSAQPVLNLSEVKGLPIPMPPAEVRETITRNLDRTCDEVRHLEILYQRKRDALADLKQSILQKALSGQLTSPPSQAIKEAAE